MAQTPSTFVWYELMTTDPAAAEAFYRTVVGWGSEPWPDAAMAYTVFKAGDQPVAGVMSLPEDYAAAGGRPAWVGYIGVSDVDAAAEDVRRAGGAVHRPPADIPEVGRFAVVADPGGTMFMLLQPKGGGEASVAPPMAPGQVGWHELYAADGAAAFDFYAGRFGWTRDQALDMGPMGTYQLFAAGGPAIGGMMTKPPSLPSPRWMFYFVVEAIDAALARVTANGGQLLNGPMEVPGGAWIIQAVDPQGALFALVAMRR